MEKKTTVDPQSIERRLTNTINSTIVIHQCHVVYNGIECLLSLLGWLIFTVVCLYFFFLPSHADNPLRFFKRLTHNLHLKMFS